MFSSLLPGFLSKETAILEAFYRAPVSTEKTRALLPDEQRMGSHSQLIRSVDCFSRKDRDLRGLWSFAPIKRGLAK